jgi:hypothetical protein
VQPGAMMIATSHGGCEDMSDVRSGEIDPHGGN